MKILITGTAGFIGFHTAKYFLEKNHRVCGIDGFTEYYDVSLKEARNDILSKYKNYELHRGMIESEDFLKKIFNNFKPDLVIHLAAQAGVRYSLENPKAYIESNINGTFNILEESKNNNVKHLMIASTSSVYGDNQDMPFKEIDKADSQLTVYSASKKSCESLGHSYSHLWKLPITIFRFFTVYGPYGRPDLALYKFTDAILKDEPIDVYNNGKMFRDFTYIDDLVKSIGLLLESIPEEKESVDDSNEFRAPFRIVNIGNSNKVNLMDFIEIIEKTLGKKAKYNFMPMQMGDVPATWADSSYLEDLVDFKPDTNIEDGIKSFINWYKDHYDIQN